MADAQVTVGASADAATRVFATLKAAGQDLGNSLKSSIGDAARVVATDLANVALSAGKVSLSQQFQQVRDFESSTAHLAVASRRDLESVRAEYEQTGISIGKRPAEVAAWSSEVGKLTYNLDGAGKGMRGIAGLAAETGRAVTDYRGLAVELGTVGHVAGDTTHVIGMLNAQADAMGNAGGVAAFADQIEGLTDTISHFRMTSEADFTRVTALSAELGKGLSAQAASRVQQSAFGAIASDPMGWSRYLGHDITDEHGQVKDPTKVLEQITNRIKHTYGKDSRRMLMLQFGSETGAALYNADFKHAAELANVTPNDKADKARQELNGTDAGKRAVAEAELSASARDLLGSSHLLGQAADAMQKFASHNPLTSTFVATALGSGMSTFMSTFGKSLATMMGGKGAGGAVGGIVDLATKGSGAPLAGLTAAKALPIVGSLVSGAVAGWEVAGGMDKVNAEYEAEKSKKDPAADASLVQLKEIRDRVRAARGMPALPGAMGGWQLPTADTKMAQEAGAGSADALAKLIAQLRKEGESADVADKIGKAVAAELQRAGIGGVSITTAPDTPAMAATRNSHSPAAGSQRRG
jgi:hypothetical protein